jgi:hypothetical protein
MRGACWSTGTANESIGVTKGLMTVPRHASLRSNRESVVYCTGAVIRLVRVYPLVDPKHLDRYLVGFDFRQNDREELGINDAEQMARAVRAGLSKRLIYEQLTAPRKPKAL